MEKFRSPSLVLLSLILISFISLFDVGLFAQQLVFPKKYSQANKLEIKFGGVTLHPGDAISVDARPDSTAFLNGVYVIDDNGKIRLPLKGEVDLTKISEAELQKELLDFYKNYLMFQNLTIEPRIRIGLVGGFIRPGLYYVNPHSSFWEVLALAGGPTERKLLEKSYLRRGEHRIRFNIYEELKKAPNIMAMGLQSGDIIEIQSPTERSLLERAATIVIPIVTSMTSLLSLYFSYQTYQNR